VAGDWIKLEMTTPDKPEVHAIASALNIEAEHVLGCLCRIWIWADEQSLNGHALSVTEKTLDRVARVPNFAKAMRESGWLTGENGAITLPNFGAHNGKTAKSRALAQRRKQVERVTKESRSNRDNSVTREEKRRSTTPKPPSGEFVRFWLVYPRHVAKKAALQAWGKLAPTPEQVEQLMVALDAAKRSGDWLREGGRFIPHPATWLNGRRFEDELPLAVDGVAPLYRREGVM